MAKFYKHNIEDSRTQHARRSQTCNQKHQPHSDLWFAEWAILHLEHIACWGLPDCYGSFRDFLFDFWPNLPWDETRSNIVCGLILDDPRFAKIAEDIEQEWGHDMTAELTICV